MVYTALGGSAENITSERCCLKERNLSLFKIYVSGVPTKHAICQLVKEGLI